MKKLMYLTITFFTFIFSFIAPMKNNFNININNNKIVEKLEPKRAFENAPEKEISLPGINKEFKIFINLTSSADCINLLKFLNNNISTADAVLFIGKSEAIVDGENVDFIFNIYYTTNTIFLNAPGENLSFNINDNDELFSNGSYFTDEQVLQTFTYFNDRLKDFTFLSVDSLIVSNVTLNVEPYLENQSYIYGYDVVSNSAVPGLIETISSIATGLLSLLISLFSSVVAIFWNVSNNTPTFLGVVLLFVVAVPITYWVINFVIGLIKKIRLTRGK